MKGSGKTDPIITQFLKSLVPVRRKIKTIYWFGSRTRGDYRSDSDYDILIVLDKRDRATISRLYDVVMDILLSTGRLVSLKIFPKVDFERLKSIPSPFIDNVLTTGVNLEKYG